jgi:protein-S-isoprenylcysteine O-methyltransferase Ste14
MTGWRAAAPFFGTSAIPILGLVLIALGAGGLLDSFVRFAWQGLGTPAPIAPTRHLVISGLYRFVRNPMYVAVTALVLGQALLLAHTSLLIYGAVVWLAFHIFVLAYEEPTLLRTFGDEYESYRRHVPRWIPRLTPWPGREQ